MLSDTIQQNALKIYLSTADGHFVCLFATQCVLMDVSAGVRRRRVPYYRMCKINMVVLFEGVPVQFLEITVLCRRRVA